MNIFCLFFLRDVHEQHLSLEDADERQSNFATKVNNLDNGKKQFKKSFFKKDFSHLF